MVDKRTGCFPTTTEKDKHGWNLTPQARTDTKINARLIAAYSASSGRNIKNNKFQITIHEYSQSDWIET